MSATELTIVQPRGRLDAAGSPALEEELRAHIAGGRTSLLVDMTETTYISSNGLRVLLAALKAARRSGGELKLCCLRPRLAEILEMVGFDQVFQIYASRAQAEEAWAVG